VTGTKTTKLQKWGNSQVVRILQQRTKKFGLVNGSPLCIKEDGKRIIIKPISDTLKNNWRNVREIILIKNSFQGRSDRKNYK
jgi:antitoxin component of MazEF toxin-antitoxin module